MSCRHSWFIRQSYGANFGGCGPTHRTAWPSPPRDAVSRFRLLVRNSAAYIAAGAANALLAVALPPILVRYLSSSEFSTWSIVLQLAAVVYVFQFGVQVAVGRYVAYTERGDTRFRAE